jgi:hypothetical protein
LRTRSAAADAEAVRPAEPVTGPAVPTGLAIGIGAVAMVAAGMVAAAIPTAYPGWRFGVVAAAVGMFAAVSLDQVALAAVAVIGFMISNGFLEDRFGQLAWHGSADMWRLMLLVIAGAWGLAAGEAYRYISRMREGKHGA